MTASSRRAPRSPGPRAADSARELADPEGKPFLRFHHSAALRRKTLSVVAALEEAEDPATHREALADLVVQLTSSGLDAYFMHPLKLANPGFLVGQSASLGMVAVQQVMGTVIRRVIGGMDGPQLLSVCGSIRQFMR